MYFIYYRDRRRQVRQEEVVLFQGIEISDFLVIVLQFFFSFFSKSVILLIFSVSVYRYQLLFNTVGQFYVRIRFSYRMFSFQMMLFSFRIIRYFVIVSGLIQYRYVLIQVLLNQIFQLVIFQYQESEFIVQVLSLLVFGFTVCYRRKVEKRKRMGEYVRQYKFRRGLSQCSQCKKSKVVFSYRQYFGNWYCEEIIGESYEDWVERMCFRGYISRKRRQFSLDEEDSIVDSF